MEYTPKTNHNGSTWQFIPKHDDQLSIFQVPHFKTTPQQVCRCQLRKNEELYSIICFFWVCLVFSPGTHQDQVRRSQRNVDFHLHSSSSPQACRTARRMKFDTKEDNRIEEYQHIPKEQKNCKTEMSSKTGEQTHKLLWSQETDSDWLFPRFVMNKNVFTIENLHTSKWSNVSWSGYQLYLTPATQSFQDSRAVTFPATKTPCLSKVSKASFSSRSTNRLPRGYIWWYIICLHPFVYITCGNPRPVK